MAEGYGLDVSTYPDLDPTFGWITGLRVVAECIARRLETRRGTLEGDAEFGLDLRAYLNDDLSTGELLLLETQVRDECEKDERVLSARVALSLNTSSSTMTVVIRLELAEGEFTLTLAVDDVSASILDFAA